MVCSGQYFLVRLPASSWITWSIFCLPVKNKQVKGRYVCVFIYAVFVLSVQWLLHQHATCKTKQSVKSALMMLTNLRWGSLTCREKNEAFGPWTSSLCLMMSWWCNNVQISCCFSICFASLSAILKQHWNEINRDALLNDIVCVWVCMCVTEMNVNHLI